MKRKKFYFFVGTTAEFIKLAPVIKEFKDREIDFKLITSGQNKILFEELSGYLGPIKADISLKEKSEKPSILGFALWGIRTFFASLVLLGEEFKGLNKRNCYFIVHGDTVTSLLGSLVAKFYRLNLVHIESGLRSFNFFEPFPEEISRYIVSRLADVHFCPNKWSVDNLKSVAGAKINTKQNTLLESFWWAERKRKPAVIKKINGEYFVLVIHRQEHVLFKKEKIKELMKYILENVEQRLSCVFITHAISLNFLKEVAPELPEEIKRNLNLIPRLPYSDFMRLIRNSEFVITDGGSNQEETYYMGKPCLLLRSRTERIEGLGKNVLLSKYNKRVIKEFINNYRRYNKNKIYRKNIKKTPSRIIVDYLIGH